MFGRLRRSTNDETQQQPVAAAETVAAPRRSRDRSWTEKVDAELASGAPGARMAVRILGPVLYELDGTIAELATTLEQKRREVESRKDARARADEQQAATTEQVRLALGPLHNELSGRGYNRRVVATLLQRLQDEVPPQGVSDTDWIMQVADECRMALIPAQGLADNPKVRAAVAATREAHAASEAAGEDFLRAEMAVWEANAEVDALIDHVSDEVVPRLMKSLDAEIADAGAAEDVVEDARARVVAVLRRRLEACKQAAGKN